MPRTTVKNSEETQVSPESFVGGASESTDTTSSTPAAKPAPKTRSRLSTKVATDAAPETAEASASSSAFDASLFVGPPASEAKASAEKTADPDSAPESKNIPVQPLKPRISRMGRGGGNFSGNRRNQGYGNRQDRGGRGYDRGDRGGRGGSAVQNQDDRNAEYIPDMDAPTQTITGILDTSRDGHGVLRAGFSVSDRDAYISTSQIRRFKLRPGDMIEGPGREPKENERYWGLLKVDKVNGITAEELAETDRVKFQTLTPVYPDSQIKLETGEEPLSLRLIDMIAPIGKGQRSLIVSPPKAGKTTLLKEIATGVAANHPEIHLMAVLVGERPEEVTDIRRHIERITNGKGEVAASNFDEPAEDQCRVAELALERAKRLVEMGHDVLILLDSITRLARAYNLAIPTSGRTLSGGFDPAAIYPTKKFFGAARNFEVNGSLTIIGTALVDTGSRMDDVIFEEFKGTGNQEIILDRRLAERRIHPSFEVQKSGTRRDDLLIDPMTYQSIMTLQRMLDTLDKEERTSTLLGQLKKTKSNKEFLASLKAA